MSLLTADVWCAVAGTSIPAADSYVYYFPKGYVEHADIKFDSSLSSAPILCKVRSVEYQWNHVLDEPFVKFVLVRSDESTRREAAGDKKKKKDVKKDDDLKVFVKVLTPSEASDVCETFSVSGVAESIFPEFGPYSKSQTLYMLDVAGEKESWEFRHLYRGPIKTGEHLLTSGWRKFVKGKNLVEGDSVVFMKRKSSPLMIGIRKENGRSFGSGGARMRMDGLIEVTYYPRSRDPMFVVSAELVDIDNKIHSGINEDARPSPSAQGMLKITEEGKTKMIGKQSLGLVEDNLLSFGNEDARPSAQGMLKITEEGKTKMMGKQSLGLVEENLSQFGNEDARPSAQGMLKITEEGKTKMMGKQSLGLVEENLLSFGDDIIFADRDNVKTYENPFELQTYLDQTQNKRTHPGIEEWFADFKNRYPGVTFHMCMRLAREPALVYQAIMTAVVKFQVDNNRPHGNLTGYGAFMIQQLPAIYFGGAKKNPFLAIITEPCADVPKYSMYEDDERALLSILHKFVEEVDYEDLEPDLRALFAQLKHKGHALRLSNFLMNCPALWDSEERCIFKFHFCNIYKTDNLKREDLTHAVDNIAVNCAEQRDSKSPPWFFTQWTQSILRSQDNLWYKVLTFNSTEEKVQKPKVRRPKVQIYQYKKTKPKCRIYWKKSGYRSTIFDAARFIRAFMYHWGEHDVRELEWALSSLFPGFNYYLYREMCRHGIFF